MTVCKLCMLFASFWVYVASVCGIVYDEKGLRLFVLVVCNASLLFC